VWIIALKPDQWEWQVYEGDTPIMMGYVTSRETAQIDGDSALFLIKDEITTPQELLARLRLINACRLVLVAVGFTVSMDRKPLVIEDDQEGYT